MSNILTNLFQKSKKKKGFTLVELIIVVAVLAVLVALLVPQYLKYVEKSRISRDLANADEITRAVQNTLADPDLYDKFVDEINSNGVYLELTSEKLDLQYLTAPNFKKALLETLNIDGTDSSLKKYKLESKSYKDRSYTVYIQSVTENNYTRLKVLSDWGQTLSGGNSN